MKQKKGCAACLPVEGTAHPLPAAKMGRTGRRGEYRAVHRARGSANGDAQLCIVHGQWCTVVHGACTVGVGLRLGVAGKWGNAPQLGQCNAPMRNCARCAVNAQTCADNAQTWVRDGRGARAWVWLSRSRRASCAGKCNGRCVVVHSRCAVVHGARSTPLHPLRRMRQEMPPERFKRLRPCPPAFRETTRQGATDTRTVYLLLIERRNKARCHLIEFALLLDAAFLQVSG